MLRTLLPLIGGALALTGAADARPDATAQVQPKAVTATTFVVSGRGWGHGVGMSQYGALGLANAGRGYAEILAHYYTGTELSPAPVSKVRVLVAEAKPTVTVSSAAPFRVRDADKKVHALPAGEVLTYEGRIADTLFHSTSGGNTIAAEEAFGTAVPYLVGVDDPFSSLSPVHAWGPLAVPDVAVRRGLKLGSPVLGVRLVRAPSGRVASAVIKTVVGQQTVSGSALRSGARLRSTWVTKLASVSLTRPAGPAVYGRKLSLVARGQGTNVTVQMRLDGAWEPVGGPGKTVSASVRLDSPTRFRLLAGKSVARVVAIPVAPRIAVKRAPTGIAGKVTPAREGATIQVQRLEGDDWLPVGEAVVAASGAFLAELELEPGSYRVRTAPAAGFAQGLSATIRAG